MIGLWIFKVYADQKSTGIKPFRTKIFLNYDVVDDFKDFCSATYKPLYPNYCYDVIKVFGTIIRY